LLLVLLTAFSLAAVTTAEARFGGSFGSRGYRTYQTVPATPTIPSTTAPIQRSMTDGATTSPRASTGLGYGSGWFNRGLFGGLGAWIFGGLLFSGLFGLLFGTGFGGFGGVFSLLIQLLIVGVVVRLLFRRFGPQPMGAGGYGGSPASGAPYDRAPRQDWQPSPGRGTGSSASQRAGSRDEIGIANADLDVFEQRLQQLQDAYSREDYDALRRITTPEVMSYLTEELAQSAAKGLRNEVFDVRLIRGDIAEAWREGDRDYATVALLYESRDVMRDRATGALASGEDSVVQRREVWTFMRNRGGDWLLSAIQEA
jgi:predicted lipid-binding transport protein (Tim44 family)